jgi:hypothetical protein
LGPDRSTKSSVNEIVLWKVNRYVHISPEALAALNGALGITPRFRRSKGAPILKLLLAQPGIDLPMASTLLRVRAQAVFHIIDRHAYRAVYGKPYPLNPRSPLADKVDVYFSYLDRLSHIANRTLVDFTQLDRILYVFDKCTNGAL